MRGYTGPFLLSDMPCLRALFRYPDYARYQRRTSRLLPWFPAPALDAAPPAAPASLHMPPAAAPTAAEAAALSAAMSAAKSARTPVRRLSKTAGTPSPAPPVAAPVTDAASARMTRAAKKLA